jgi:hypothetical protein
VLATELAPGLLRWRAPHPGWHSSPQPGGPDDWAQLVGSVLYLLPDTAVLIDPLLPAEDRSGFLQWLDSAIAQRPVSILTTIRWHRRDREQLAERYAGRSTGVWNAVPAGVKPRPLRGAAETLFWLPGAGALVCGDRLIGAEAGAIQLCPESWLRGVRVDRAAVAHLMRPLLELPIELVVVSHGEPVLHDGRAALARALAEAGGG